VNELPLVQNSPGIIVSPVLTASEEHEKSTEVGGVLGAAAAVGATVAGATVVVGTWVVVEFSSVVGLSVAGVTTVVSGGTESGVIVVGGVLVSTATSSPPPHAPSTSAMTAIAADMRTIVTAASSLEAPDRSDLLSHHRRAGDGPGASANAGTPSLPVDHTACDPYGRCAACSERPELDDDCLVERDRRGGERCWGRGNEGATWVHGSERTRQIFPNSVEM